MTPCGLQLAQAVPHEQAGGGVEPGARLVQEQHERRVHQRPRDHDPLGLPAAEHVGLHVGAIEQPELREQLVGPPLALAGGHAVVRGVEHEVVPDRERAIEVAALRHDGELAAGPHLIACHVDPSDERAAGGRAHAGREDADRGGLARAVRPEQPEHLAASDREADAVDGVPRRLRVALDELFDLDSGRAAGRGCARDVRLLQQGVPPRTNLSPNPNPQLAASAARASPTARACAASIQISQRREAASCGRRKW